MRCARSTSSLQGIDEPCAGHHECSSGLCREEYLEGEYGVEVYRFSNEEVVANTRAVLEEIWKLCAVK